MNFVLHKQKIHGWDMSKRIIVVYSDRTYVGTGAGPGPILCQTLHIATFDPPQCFSGHQMSVGRGMRGGSQVNRLASDGHQMSQAGESLVWTGGGGSMYDVQRGPVQ